MQTTVNAFKFLLCERFSSKAIEVTSVFFDVELSELKQRSDESLIAYYKRVINLMQRVEIKDRASIITLILLESIMLNIILRVFIRDLFDSEIRKKTTRDMTSSDKSLKIIYQLIEKARRINLKIQKLFDEKFKQDELIFYKQLA